MTLMQPSPYGSHLAPRRRICDIAREIREAWGAKVSPYAKPYLDAMAHLEGPMDTFGADSAQSVCLYFLSNASGFRGEEAKRLKAELKALFGVKP